MFEAGRSATPRPRYPFLETDDHDAYRNNRHSAPGNGAPAVDPSPSRTQPTTGAKRAPNSKTGPTPPMLIGQSPCGRAPRPQDIATPQPITQATEAHAPPQGGDRPKSARNLEDRDSFNPTPPALPALGPDPRSGHAPG